MGLDLPLSVIWSIAVQVALLGMAEPVRPPCHSCTYTVSSSSCLYSGKMSCGVSVARAWRIRCHACYMYSAASSRDKPRRAASAYDTHSDEFLLLIRCLILSLWNPIKLCTFIAYCRVRIPTCKTGQRGVDLAGVVISPLIVVHLERTGDGALLICSAVEELTALAAVDRLRRLGYLVDIFQTAISILGNWLLDQMGRMNMPDQCALKASILNGLYAKTIDIKQLFEHSYIYTCSIYYYIIFCSSFRKSNHKKGEKAVLCQVYKFQTWAKPESPLKDLCLIPLALSLRDTCVAQPRHSPHPRRQNEAKAILHTYLSYFHLSRLIFILPPRHVKYEKTPCRIWQMNSLQQYELSDSGSVLFRCGWPTPQPKGPHSG